ncbi:MAG: hypothetical protein A2937_00735 [Candidatus Yonathbacteria bacterium RIFCSPLOWO2_01_FULL_47_33b]|uniref:Uncharacterized protein n=1 Tax=Candidatus Yonathbacteria bacterium RIFCSPLOWO2_01_FULL_47_33b TaxID=1802727 RepID=A0A1G2SE67_9BACT|nr:MAG: hypothetical protein A2937_00735 [Candidatus Yonathbacteria bacterium RIFCSPLOWO2_01_FULL_47_33b]
MNIIEKLNDLILNPLIVLLFAVAAGYFLFGLLRFIQNQDNETAQEEGKRHMVWGVIGIFLMVAVYGILNLIGTTVGNITQ